MAAPAQWKECIVAPAEQPPALVDGCAVHCTGRQAHDALQCSQPSGSGLIACQAQPPPLSLAQAEERARAEGKQRAVAVQDKRVPSAGRDCDSAVKLWNGLRATRSVTNLTVLVATKSPDLAVQRGAQRVVVACGDGGRPRHRDAARLVREQRPWRVAQLVAFVEPAAPHAAVFQQEARVRPASGDLCH